MRSVKTHINTIRVQNVKFFNMKRNCLCEELKPNFRIFSGGVCLLCEIFLLALW